MNPAAAAPSRTGAPALREAHAHLYQLGRSQQMLELSGCGSADELLGAFAERSGHSTDAPCLLGQGARPESWPDPAWPDLPAFDRATGNVPALAWCFDYHALLANSAMLALAGIDRHTPDPPGGIIQRTPDGQPTGAVYESAALLVWNAAPEPAADQQPRVLAAALESLSRFGEIHDLKSQPWLGPVLAEVLLTHAPDTRVVLFPLVEDLDATLATRTEWESPLLRLGGAKIFVDGTLNSRTAWMLHPYADGRPDHPRGTPMMTPRQIEDAVRQCDASGLPLAAHAIGDGAVRAVLDAIETVRPKARGFRIEHAEIIDEADVPRFAELGVIASVQPCHLLYDIEALRKAMPDRLDRVLPLRELIDAGCTPGSSLLFGSDVPIVRSDPEDSILAATARRRADMRAQDAISPQQAITEDEAWRCFRAEA